MVKTDKSVHNEFLRLAAIKNELLNQQMELFTETIEEQYQDDQKILKRQEEFLKKAMERPEVETLATLKKKSHRQTLHLPSLCLDCSVQIKKQYNTKSLVDEIGAKRISEPQTLPAGSAWMISDQIAKTYRGQAIETCNESFEASSRGTSP